MNTLKLNKIAARELKKKELSSINGGTGPKTIICSCGCQYANSGGSSIDANCSANNAKGFHPPKGVTPSSYCGTTIL